MTKEERTALLDILDNVDALKAALCLCSLDYKIMDSMQGGELTTDEDTQAVYFDGAWERMERAFMAVGKLQRDVYALRDNFEDDLMLHL